MEHTEGELVSSDNFPNLLQIGNNTILCVFPNGCTTAQEILLRKANIKHTKECWNSHDALTQELADYKEGCEGLKLTALDFKQQRDALLVACKIMLIEIEGNNYARYGIDPGAEDETGSAMIGRQAIANAEKE